MACGEIPPIELGRGRKKGVWLDIPGPVLIATLHYAAPPTSAGVAEYIYTLPNYFQVPYNICVNVADVHNIL
jgi:hypothetical protein